MSPKKPRCKNSHIQSQTWIGPRDAPQMTNCIEQPTDDEIKSELASLPGGEQISSVKIIISKTHSIAAAGSVSEGFYVRYEEYSAAGRWEATDHELPLAIASRLLSEYRDETDTWRSLTAWQRCSIKKALSQQQEERKAEEIVSLNVKAVRFVWALIYGPSKK